MTTMGEDEMFTGFSTSNPNRLYLEFRDIAKPNGFAGFNENILSELIDLTVKPGMVCVDCGANVGKHALHFARRVGDSGRVIAVEPNPVMFKRLLERAEKNKIASRIDFHNVAVSSAVGEASFFAVKERPALSRIGASVAFMEEHDGEEIKVPVSTVDMIAEARSASFIKIDVEGHEFSVLSGARETIEASRPIIFFETNLVASIKRGSYSAEAIFGLFEELDYELFSSIGQRISASQWERPMPTNFVAFPRKRSAEILEALHMGVVKVVSEVVAAVATKGA